MHTSIVVPLNGSDFGTPALPAARTRARRRDAALHIVDELTPDVFARRPRAERVLEEVASLVARVL